MKSKILFLIGVAFLYLALAAHAQRPSVTRPDSIKRIPFGVKLPSPSAAMEMIPKDKRIPDNPMQANGGKQMSADKSPAGVPYSGVDHLAEQYKKYIESKKPADNPLPSLSAYGSIQQSRPTQNGQVANFHLTKDINAATPNSYPSNFKYGYNQQSFAILNGVSYFAADDGIHGSELWRSDGTNTGTYLVKDITPGGAGSSLENITAIDGLLYFSAFTDAYGQEAWVSDGTETGTDLLLDINIGPGSAHPSQFVKANNTIIFTTENDYVQGQLWKTNGTPAGTIQIYGFNGSDPYAGYVTQATEVNGLYFFSAWTPAFGRELWRSDGTTAGTFLVKDVGPGVDDSKTPMQLTKYNNKLYYSGDDGTGRSLWCSDGTSAGTLPVVNNNVFTQNEYTDYSFNMPFAVLGNVLYLAGYTAATGSGLYKYDASLNAGITLVKDLTSGGEVDFITAPELRVVGNSLYFKVISAIGGYHDELWTSEGKPDNTYLVKEWAPGNVTTNYYNINGKLYFVEDDPGYGVYGPELWTTDGTAQGTRLVKDIYQGRQGSFPFFITSFKGKVLFSAIGLIAGAELWLSDGTTAGTVLVKDINAAITFGSDPGHFYNKGLVSLGSKVVFGAFEPEHGEELYVSDGTKSGTKLLNDINPGPDWSYPFDFLAKKDAAYFRAYSLTGPALFKTDGTSAGLQKIIDISSTSDLSNYAVADNGIVFYVLFSYNTGNYELWRSDGSASGTYLLSQNLYYNNSLVTAGNTAFFVAGDNDHGYELWKSDGSVRGTKMVTDIFPGVNGSTPYSLFAFKNDVYFGATDNLNYSLSFWKSNGNVAIKLKDVFPDFSFNGYYYAGSNPYCVSGNELYFSAFDQNFDNELYKTKGAPGNTKLIKDINPFYSSSPTNLTDVNGELFFIADDGINGNELWSSNGTTEGTKLLKDITPGATSGFLDNLCSVGDKLYFLNYTGNTSIWSSDGTEAGTNIVDDPGLAGLLNFNYLTPADNKLFFGAYSYLYGTELYVGYAASKTFIAARASSSDNIAEEKLNTTFDAVLYPNPVHGSASLQIKGNPKNVVVTISDISGKILWQKSFTNQSKINLPMEKINAGSYLLTLKTETENRTIKFIKQ